MPELIGKRLPDEIEYEFATTFGGQRQVPWGDDLKRITDWPCGPIGQPDFDRLETVPPVVGLYSNVAEIEDIIVVDAIPDAAVPAGEWLFAVHRPADCPRGPIVRNRGITGSSSSFRMDPESALESCGNIKSRGWDFAALAVSIRDSIKLTLSHN